MYCTLPESYCNSFVEFCTFSIDVFTFSIFRQNLVYFENTQHICKYTFSNVYQQSKMYLNCFLNNCILRTDFYIIILLLFAILKLNLIQSFFCHSAKNVDGMSQTGNLCLLVLLFFFILTPAVFQRDPSTKSRSNI